VHFTARTPYVYLMAAAPISEAEHVIDAVHATPAERKLELFRTRWNGSVDPVFHEFAY